MRYGKSYRIYQSVGEGYRTRTELTKVSGTGIELVPNLQGRTWDQGVLLHQGILLRAYRTYQSVGYGFECRTELTKGSGRGTDVLPSLLKGSGMVRLLVPGPGPDLMYFNRAVSGTRVFLAGVPNLPKCRVRVWMSYRTYQRVGYGYGNRTKLTKVSGTGNARGMYPLYTLVRTLPNTISHDCIR